MLRVNTYVASSHIHGRGLYAAEAIRRGQVVWAFEPSQDRVLSDAALEAFSTEDPAILTYVYEEEPGRWVLCGDNAIFMNHAEEPTCRDPDPTVTVAARDIAVGEELTVDYRQFDLSASRWLTPARDSA